VLDPEEPDDEPDVDPEVDPDVDPEVDPDDEPEVDPDDGPDVDVPEVPLAVPLVALVVEPVSPVPLDPPSHATRRKASSQICRRIIFEPLFPLRGAMPSEPLVRPGNGSAQ